MRWPWATVEDAEARSARRRRVVKSSAEVKRDLAFACQQSFRGLDASTRFEPSGLIHPVENGVVPGVESIVMRGDVIVAAAQASHGVDVLGRVKAGQLLM